MMRSVLLTLLLFTIPWLCVATAAVIHVPADFDTIQEAIDDAASKGDTVLVAPGIYGENLNFRGKAVAVISSEGPYSTFIDGRKYVDPDFRSVAFFGSWEGPDTVLAGFTLRNGMGTRDLNSLTYGGAIYCMGSSPTIRDNIITDNGARYGGAIFMSNASPRIHNNIFRKNDAYTSGAALWCVGASEPEIVGNSFNNNTSFSDNGCIGCVQSSARIIDNRITLTDVCGIYCEGYCELVITGNFISQNTGSGIRCENGADAEIRDNIIEYNAAEYGGGIMAYVSKVEIENNVIRNNTAEKVGGAISIVHCMTDVRISGNTITGNKADYQGGGISCFMGEMTILHCDISGNTGQYGGAVACFEQSSAVISDCTMLDNYSAEDGGAIFCDEGSSLTLDNSIVCNNETDRRGGGIYCGDDSSTAIWRCLIQANRAVNDEGGGVYFHCSLNLPFELKDSMIIGNTAADEGGGVFCRGGIHDISRNVIAGNTSGSEGGGVNMGQTEDKESSVFAGNVIHDNIAARGGGVFFSYSDWNTTNNLIHNNIATEYGGGMFMYGTGFGKYANNTIVQNTADQRGGGIFFNSCDAKISNMILRYNQSPDGENYYLHNASDPVINYSIIDDSFHGVGNLDVDPRFVDLTGRDFHLRYDSPCRDAGDTNAVLSPVDFEGDPCPAHDWIDMGADEFYPHLYCTGNATPGGLVYVKLIGMPGTHPVWLFVGSGVLDPPLPTSWGDFFLAPPLLWLALPLIPAAGVLTLPAHVPNAPPAPYDIPLQALIGLEPNALSNLELLQIR